MGAEMNESGIRASRDLSFHSHGRREARRWVATRSAPAASFGEHQHRGAKLHLRKR